MKVHDVAWVIFVWVVFSLAAYRLQRIVTSDSWPPSRAFRIWLRRTFGEFDSQNPKSFTKGAITEFFYCPWCFGTWATLGLGVLLQLFVVDLLTGHIRNRLAFLALVMWAAATIVGQLGMRDD